jgi:hypothetical protein
LRPDEIGCRVRPFPDDPVPNRADGVVEVGADRGERRLRPRDGGLRALRARVADVTALLRPLDEPEERDGEASAPAGRESGTMRRDGDPAD